MDRVFSTRLDEAVLCRIGDLAKQLGISKKAVVEKAIASFAAEVEHEQHQDVFERTFGVWRRKASAAELVRRARSAFNDSLARHQR